MESKISTKEQLIAKKVGRYRLVKAATKLYNSVCLVCKHKIIRDPKMDVKDYCDECQEYVKEFEKVFK